MPKWQGAVNIGGNVRLLCRIAGNDVVRKSNELRMYPGQRCS
jgi:hypothetical protein